MTHHPLECFNGRCGAACPAVSLVDLPGTQDKAALTRSAIAWASFESLLQPRAADNKQQSITACFQASFCLPTELGPTPQKNRWCSYDGSGIAIAVRLTAPPWKAFPVSCRIPCRNVRRRAGLGPSRSRLDFRTGNVGKTDFEATERKGGRKDEGRGERKEGKKSFCATCKATNCRGPVAGRRQPPRGGRSRKGTWGAPAGLLLPRLMLPVLPPPPRKMPKPCSQLEMKH